LQEDALKEAGCGKIFIEQTSGAVRDRPVLLEVLDYARSGDALIVWKLDRLARSMKQARARALSDEGTLELSQRAEHMKNQDALRRGRVD
jgi:DNA invertase Pin-like site-specific DNA recombinase